MDSPVLLELFSQTVALWKDGREVGTITADHGMRYRFAAMNANASRVCTIGTTTEEEDESRVLLQLTDVRADFKLLCVRRVRAEMTCADFSPTGFLAIGCASGHLKLWRVTDAFNIVLTAKHANGRVHACRFSPDGTKLASACAVHVTVRNTLTCRILCVVPGTTFKWNSDTSMTVFDAPRTIYAVSLTASFSIVKCTVNTRQSATLCKRLEDIRAKISNSAMHVPRAPRSSGRRVPQRQWPML